MTVMKTFAFVLTSICAVAQFQQVMAQQHSQPNVLFIFCDDLTCQAISAYGESRHLLETPNIDRLAKQGVRFDRCLVTNSICGPSRASILTGKYSHLNGFYNNSFLDFLFISNDLKFFPLFY